MPQSIPNKKNIEIKSKNLILALETSGRTGSVALGDISQMLGEINFSANMRHSAELFPAVQTLLRNVSGKPSDIKQVFISTGPGSFTGLRIAVAFAKTLNLAMGTKIVSIDTLDAIAENAFNYIGENQLDINRIATILDAKRGQFFTAAYERNKNGWEKILDDCLKSNEEFLKEFANKDKPIWLLGEGLVYYKDKFKGDGISFFDETLWTPKASQIYRLGLAKSLAGDFADPLALEPLYLRRALDN